MEEFVQINVIDKKKVHCIKNINIRKFCQSLIHELGGEEFKDASLSSRSMENKLLKRFGDEVRIIKGPNGQVNNLLSKTLSIPDASHEENSTTKLQDVQLRDAALIQPILSREPKPLPEKWTIDSVLHGTTNVPPKLN